MIAPCKPQQMSRNPSLHGLAVAASAIAEIGNYEIPNGRKK